MRRNLLATLGLLFLAVATPASADEIRALSGTFQDEPVRSIALDGGKHVLKTDKRTIPLENVKSVRFDDRAPPEGGGVKVLLVTRDWLRGTITGGAGSAVKVKTGALGEVEVDLGNVVGMLFNVPAEKEREIEAKRLATPPKDDTVYLVAGGKPEGSIDAIDENGITITCPPPLGKLPIALAKAEALATSRDAQNKVTPPTELLVRLRLSCGSLVEGPLVALENAEIKVKHKILGAKKADVVTVRQKDVIELSVVNGAFAYLSDLDPANVVEKFPPEFDRPADIWGWKRDKEVLKGGRLRLGGRSYEKGLGVHSYCELEFTLNGSYSEFRSVIGLDDSTRYLGQPGLGGVVFRVLVDGKPAKEVGEAGLKKMKGEAPSEIAVDVAGAKKLTLIADYGFMHVLGRADWADAYLVKKR